MQDHRLDLGATQYRLTIDHDEQSAPEPTRYPSKSEAVAALDALCAERGWIASAVYDERRGSIRSGDDDYVGSWSIDLDVPDFLTVLGVDDIATHDFRAAWERSAADETIRIPVGYHRDGDELLPTIDYLEIGETNVAVTGRTGTGKSYLLRGLALGLAATYGPQRLRLVFADSFPGATFLGLDNLPHTVGWAMDAGQHPEEFDRLITWLEAEVDRRRPRVATGEGRLPQLVAFMDELVPLFEEVPVMAERVLRLAQRGPSAGLHLILGSQYLTSSAGGGVLDYCGARYSLALNSAAHSRDMLGVDDAATMLMGPLHGKVLRWFGDGDVTQLVALPSQARVGGPSMSVTADAALLDQLTAVADAQ